MEGAPALSKLTQVSAETPDVGNGQGPDNSAVAELWMQGTAEPWREDSQTNLGISEKAP